VSWQSLPRSCFLVARSRLLESDSEWLDAQVLKGQAVPNANRVETIAKYAAILSALVAMAVGIGQYRRGVSQSIRELEWKQADMARSLINGMMNDEGWQAMTMLDWEEGRDYEISPGAKVHILPRDVPLAIEASLRADGPKRTETQRFITDRYDRFFFRVSQLQSAVRSGLVRHDDVRFPLEWYVEKRMCRHKKLLLAYMAENSTIESKEFFESLDAWRRCSSD
jgi:hypothetical protein